VIIVVVKTSKHGDYHSRPGVAAALSLCSR